MGAKGWVATSAVNAASAMMAAHSSGRIGGANWRRAKRLARRATTARAAMATQMSATKKAAMSQLGGPGMRYDMRGHAPTHFTTARSDAARKPSMRASNRDKRAQTNVARSVRKQSGTINPVRITAGILLSGPARLTR